MRRNVEGEIKFNGSTSITNQFNNKVFRNVDTFIRLCVIPFCVASLLVMVKSKQVTDDYGMVYFSSISGLKYLVWTNAIYAGYSFASTVLKFLRFSTTSWFFYVLDQVMAYLSVTIFSAVSEVVYLVHDGDKKVAWSEVCTYFGKFCNRIQVSLLLHVVAVVCFIILALISAYSFFSSFDPPSSSVDSTEAVEQTTEGVTTV